MIDSSDKSIEDLTFASPMRKSSSSRARHIVATFATICWFHELRLQMNATTVAQIRRMVEPLTTATQEQEKRINRRWRDYRDGQHSPMEPVIAKAEACCRGARQILQSPLWTALRLDKPAEQAALALMGCTSSSGNELLAKALSFQTKPRIDYRWLYKRCDAITRDGTLEGLGVLTVCMRLTADADFDYLAAIFFKAATRHLIILGGWMINHGIARGIAEYYELVLLPHCNKRRYLAIFSSEVYLHTAFTLKRALEKHATDKGVELSHEKAVEAMWEFLLWGPCDRKG